MQQERHYAVDHKHFAEGQSHELNLFAQFKSLSLLNAFFRYSIIDIVD